MESNIQNISERNYQARIIYSAKLSFRYEGEIKTFPDIQKLREFSTMRPTLQEILKGVSSPKTKWQKKPHIIRSKVPIRQIEAEECNPY